MTTEVDFFAPSLGSIGELNSDLRAFQDLEQPTGAQVDASGEVLKNIPGAAESEEEVAALLGTAGTVFALSNAVPGIGTVGGAIAAAAIIIGPLVFKGLKEFFVGKENPWVKRMRKLDNSNASPLERWQAAWAMRQTAIEQVKRLEVARRRGGAAARIATNDDLRWDRGAVIATTDRMNKIFPTIPLAQRVKVEPLVVTAPNTAKFLQGFPVKIVNINKMSDDQIKLWIGAFDSRLRFLNNLIAKGVTSAIFTRDQLGRYKAVYQGVLFARQKTRADIAARNRKSAADRRAFQNFIRFLQQLETQIKAIDVSKFNQKQVVDTLAIAGAARQQAVAINARGVIAAIDAKTVELNARLKQIKQRKFVGAAATIASVGALAVRLIR